MVIRKQDSQESNTDASREGKRDVWHGIIGNGQSLSVGFQGDLPQPTAPAPHAFCLRDTADTYDIDSPNASTLQLVPLVEPLRTHEGGTGDYPTNIDGLTPHHSMACVIEHMHERHARESPPFISTHTVVGKGGALMDVIRKHKDPSRSRSPDNSYAASIFETRAMTQLARERGADLQFDAVVLTHGETDAVMQNEEYGDDVIQMQKDYAVDVAEVTGQTHEPILILSQQNTSPPHRAFLPKTMNSMWKAQQNAAGKVVCAGPKYQFAYAPGGLHLDASGYSRLGEKYGQVFYQTVVQGKTFVPLSPTTATFHKTKNEIVVSFEVPVPPLRWDETLAKPHRGTRCQDFWANGRGFEVRDKRGKRLTIERARICDEQGSVAVELRECKCEDGEDAQSPLNLAYAMTQEGEGFGPGFCGGSSEGRMGWLCDSDAGPGLSVDLGTCEVQRGSKIVYRNDGWERRALYDIIEPAAYTVVWIEGKTAEIDRAWEGESGSVDHLNIRHNQRNYCIAFAMDVEDTK